MGGLLVKGWLWVNTVCVAIWLHIQASGSFHHQQNENPCVLSLLPGSLLFTFSPPLSSALVAFFFASFVPPYTPLATEKSVNILPFCFSTLLYLLFHQCLSMFLSLAPLSSSLPHSVVSHPSHFPTSASPSYTLSLTHNHSSSTLSKAIHIRCSCHLSEGFFYGNIFTHG